MITIKAAKQNFFDRPGVQKAMDAATRRNLSKFGSFVRQTARSSIRKAPQVDIASGQKLRGRRRKGQVTRDAISTPGQPPYSHVGLVKKFLFFSYDPARKSVVIGPVLLSSRRPGAPGQGLELLEHGGAGTLRTRKGQRRVNYRARPFMGPAFQRELQQLPAIWKDSLREV